MVNPKIKQRKFFKSLRHQIKFLENKKLTEIDPDNWVEVITTYASINHLNQMNFSMIENFSFGHVMTEALFLFKIRFIPNVNNKMKILFSNRQFEIKKVINPAEVSQVLNIIALEI